MPECDISVSLSCTVNILIISLGAWYDTNYWHSQKIWKNIKKKFQKKSWNFFHAFHGKWAKKFQPKFWTWKKNSKKIDEKFFPMKFYEFFFHAFHGNRAKKIFSQNFGVRYQKLSPWVWFITFDIALSTEGDKFDISPQCNMCYLNMWIFVIFKQTMLSPWHLSWNFWPVMTKIVLDSSG